MQSSNPLAHPRQNPSMQTLSSDSQHKFEAKFAMLNTRQQPGYRLLIYVSSGPSSSVRSLFLRRVNTSVEPSGRSGRVQVYGPLQLGRFLAMTPERRIEWVNTKSAKTDIMRNLQISCKPGLSGFPQAEEMHRPLEPVPLFGSVMFSEKFLQPG